MSINNPIQIDSSGIQITSDDRNKIISVTSEGLKFNNDVLTTQIITNIGANGFDFDGEIVSWDNIYNLRQATPALRLPATANDFVIDNTLECNDNNLAKTRTAVLSAPPSVEPSLTLNNITTGDNSVLTTETLTLNQSFSTNSAVLNGNGTLNLNDIGNSSILSLTPDSGLGISVLPFTPSSKSVSLDAYAGLILNNTIADTTATFTSNNLTITDLTSRDNLIIDTSSITKTNSPFTIQSIGSYDISITSSDAINLSANGSINTNSDTFNVDTIGGIIDLTSATDINLTTNTSITGKININANDGVIINRQGIKPPDTITTTLTGAVFEMYADTVSTGVVGLTSIDNSQLYIDRTDNAISTQQYGRLEPNQLEIYDHTSNGRNASFVIINSEALNYQQSGTKPTFYKFNYFSNEIFRYDTNGIKTANNKTIVLTDGTTTNTINYLGYTTRNTTANASHYLNFSDSSTTGTGSIQKTAGISCNPSTNTITATTFSGTATNATNVVLTSDNTSGTYYIPFVKTSGSGNKPLFIDDTTGPLSYNPSTAILSANTYTINTTPSTSTSASQFGQVGLVKLQTLTASITGSASPTNFNLPNIFNSTYKNYRIVLSPTTQVAFTSYPGYSLQAFLGTGTLPTTASLYGYEITSNSSSVVSPVYTANSTISSSPLIFSVSSITNKQVVFEISNVGYSNTANQNVYLTCKSFYGNPGVSGTSDRNIASTSLSGATITGLTIQQTAISVGNNMTIQAIVYGYNEL